MHKLCGAFFLGFLFAFSKVLACTGILLTAKDGSTINGRTVEFGRPIAFTIAVFPRGLVFEGKTPHGSGLTYKSKFAAVGAYSFNDQVLMDGMNEKGLVAAAFYFPGYAAYTPITAANQSRALSPIEFPHWILTQFASLDEVRAALPSIVIAPTVSPSWGSTPPPMHYIVYDKPGRSIVIEPVDGTLIVYENKIGVITNSPTFDWHLTNLRNFINLTPFNKNPLTIRGVKLASFGQGSGLVGLPGDFTPPSRFVRAALFSATAIPLKNSEECVFQTFHLLNHFDIPYGSVRQSSGQETHYDYTMMTSVKDPQTLKYYYKAYDDQSINHVDLNEFDPNDNLIRSFKPRSKQESYNISSMLR